MRGAPAPTPPTHTVRPRYRRIVAATAALITTATAVLGGVGLPPDGSRAAAATGGSGDAASLSALTVPTPTSTTGSTGPEQTGSERAEPPVRTAVPPTPSSAVTGPPAESGTGKRVVFDISDQRVWLVDADGEVTRSYLVSGSLLDNLDPGTYDVYSRSRWAVGIADSGVMQYFVRFTRGENAAIGFHSIPTKDGRPLQTRAQLGTAQSHGCIRQAMPDAKALWAFAPEGTAVVVTA